MKSEQPTVIAALRITANRYPNRTALRYPGGTMPYHELIARMDGLACALRARAIGSGDRVGIHLRRSPALIVALLGVLAAGAAYVPLDPDNPRLRLRHIAADSQIDLLLGEADAADLLADVPRLDPAEWPVFAAAHALPTPAPGDLAYLIYTSGSTGLPKGVAIEHRALANYLAWAVANLPATGGGAPLIASVSFDHAVTSIYPPLLTGEPLTLLPPVQGGLHLASGLLDGHRYSFVKITPSHLRLLDANQRAQLGASTDLVMLGGERAGWDLVQQLRRDAPHVAVMNHYGPTEATVGCCTFLTPAEPTGETLPIGRPIPGMQVLVCSESGAPCGVGEPGELYIGGVGLAREYWGNHYLTAQRFMVLPDANGQPTRWYRSGDLVVERPDGALAYLGRLDEQIKIMGHRVEPAEIEAVIRLYPGVRDAAVLAYEQAGGLQLIAGVVGDALTEVELRQHVRGYLPSVMVPSRFVFVAHLPVAAGGKLDRRALLALAGAADHDQAPGAVPGPAAAEAPSGPPSLGDIEYRLRMKWRQALGVETIGLDDDFFELGGDSLANVEIVSWVAQFWGVQLELSALFAYPTIRTLAAAIARPRPQDPTRTTA